ncbi:hypothetical protein LQ327_31315 [Actinomycetospora endophytica]|uniref:AMMECR1 domain-containing protein n=1 Tax=Actinomycetospora endophytica TaxID=2291215 RepID=A0ABS8PHX2_9PSEU|nr:AMMECR1 domain-containing protein [Actinomycetospora endophytica]MCD2197868.1 hypothetical protein [Actinomycetospora endophytica]
MATSAEVGTTGFTAQDRERLRERLCREGFLRQEQGVHLSGADGSPRAWMLYTWAVSATGSGARLIARALLDQMADFGASQLAAFGLTAAPLVSACVVLDDRYTALAVRAAAKGHGPGWRVDGDRGPDVAGRRVVVVDDSLSSGRAFLTAATILEAEGFEVEGLVALVEFPGRGGRERLEGLGYRVRTVFDVWTDLHAPGPPAVAPADAVAVTWSDVRTPDGLRPAEVARAVLEHLVATGETPLPPAELAAPVDGRGGVFVSLRRRDDDRRLARGGFWHFDATDADPTRDLVLAATATANRLGAALTAELLETVKIAVSFLGPLELTTPAELDFDRYGVVVRSRVWSAKVGGALPNTQYFTSTFEQYLHARWTNARIDEIEPHDVFRHTVVKDVEPGETWLPYGTAPTETWPEDLDLGARLTGRVRQALHGESAGTSLDDDLVPTRVEAVAVTLYAPSPPHAVVGHGLGRPAEVGSFDAAAAAAAENARATTDLADATACVSVLHHPETLVATDAPWAMRRGRDAVEAREGDRQGLLTEYAVAHHELSARETGERLTRMTGTTAPTWTTYQSATWLDRPGDDVRRLTFGAVDRPGHRLTAPDVELLATHLRRRADADGWPSYAYDPRTGRDQRSGTAARCVHGLRVLLDAGARLGREDWLADARRGLQHARRHLDLDGQLRIPRHEPSGMASACLLAGVEPHDDRSWADELARHVAGWVRDDGSVREPGVVPTRSEPDYLPGAAVVGLARYHRAGGKVDVDADRVLAFYRRRFRCLRPWSLASWHAQGWAEWHRSGAPGGRDAPAFVFELADRMVGEQLRADGSYLVDLGSHAPTVLTGFVAEGVGAAWRLAEDLGERERARRYADSHRAAMGFLDRLLIRREDTFWTAEPERALGGVRAALATADLRVDYTGHTLSALLHAT